MTTVAEIMNREVFGLAAEATCGEARRRLATQGLSAAPVVLGERALGFVSWRDLVDAPADQAVAARMTTPAIVVAASDAVDQAARLFAERGLHHAPVVDPAGRMVGFLSLIDLLRALEHLPASHPSNTLRRDPHTGALWSDDARLDPEHAEAAPDGPGVVIVVELRPGHREQVIVVEECAAVRPRIRELAAALSGSRPFARELAHGGLHVRWSVIADPAERLRVRDRAIELVDVRERLARSERI